MLFVIIPKRLIAAPTVAHITPTPVPIFRTIKIEPVARWTMPDAGMINLSQNVSGIPNDRSKHFLERMRFFPYPI